MKRMRDGMHVVGVIGILATVAGSLMPGLPGFVAVNDRIIHFVVYAGLAFWYAITCSKKTGIIIGIALAALGGVLEIAQGLTGWRTCSLDDFAADFAGVFYALLVRYAVIPQLETIGHLVARRWRTSVNLVPDFRAKNQGRW